MVTTRTIEPGDIVPTADQRLIWYQVPWSHYQIQLALRGEASVPRMAYLEGTLELMRPCKEHERIKSYIGRLVETYALERGVELSPYGAWTLKYAPRETGVEPDECYLVGSDQGRDRPDLAIEVIWTSGGLDKLEIYRRLGVAELWFWRSGAIEIYVLGANGYARAERSACLPGLDVALLCAHLDRPTLTQAIRDFRAALASG
ncbi:MAG TPA: Uma2 family endonuclease [Kofleriaceae bacterium]|nr:Uma2 family endonuclease [Kofleriaceae bacterium]